MKELKLAHVIVFIVWENNTEQNAHIIHQKNINRLSRLEFDEDNEGSELILCMIEQPHKKQTWGTVIATYMCSVPAFKISE